MPFPNFAPSAPPQEHPEENPLARSLVEGSLLVPPQLIPLLPRSASHPSSAQSPLKYLSSSRALNALRPQGIESIQQQLANAYGQFFSSMETRLEDQEAQIERLNADAKAKDEEIARLKAALAVRFSLLPILLPHLSSFSQDKDKSLNETRQALQNLQLMNGAVKTVTDQVPTSSPSFLSRLSPRIKLSTYLLLFLILLPSPPGPLWPRRWRYLSHRPVPGRHAEVRRDCEEGDRRRLPQGLQPRPQGRSCPSFILFS